jgi:Ribosomal protein L36e
MGKTRDLWATTTRSRASFPSLCNMAGIAVGLEKGHQVTKREVAARPARRRGALSQRIKKVRCALVCFEMLFVLA